MVYMADILVGFLALRKVWAYGQSNDVRFFYVAVWIYAGLYL